METKTTKSGRTFHRDNCQARVRKSHINRFGDKICLFGRHGFEWSVGIIKASNPSFMCITEFAQGREVALSYFNQLCKQ